MFPISLAAEPLWTSTYSKKPKPNKIHTYKNK